MKSLLLAAPPASAYQRRSNGHGSGSGSYGGGD
jgi:hypothetical protein